MRLRELPAIITLVAALVACLVMIFRGVPLQSFLISLFLVILVFGIFSIILRRILIKLLTATQTKEEKAENEEATGEDSETSSEDVGQKDGSTKNTKNTKKTK